jgi:hypothetical protein
MVYERSPIDSFADPTPSSASHASTASRTRRTLRDSRSDRTLTSLRAPSNETDDPVKDAVKPPHEAVNAGGVRKSNADLHHQALRA